MLWHPYQYVFLEDIQVSHSNDQDLSPLSKEGNY